LKSLIFNDITGKPENLKDNKVYLPGLNGLRAIAAISVLISHCIQERHQFGLEKASGLPVGGFSVTAFFTLSGFLITYLLLLEKKSFQRIDIKDFYLRRIFRIWPLYYFYIFLALTLSFIFLGQLNENIKYIWLFIFFIPNIAFNLNLYPQFLGHLWSIGVEEQFYLVWPQVFQKASNLKKKVIIFILLFLGLKLCMKLISVYINSKIPFSIISCMRFDCMAIGALLAIIYESGLTVKRPILLIAQVMFWVMFLGSFVSEMPFFSIYGDEVFSVLTAFFILGQLNKSDCLISLESSIFNFLGGISYGIYVYHVIVIFLLKLFFVNNFQTQFPGTAFLIILVLLLTVILSFFSYRYFESYFLKIKNKFTKLVSVNHPS
jgi:peptidoglycan/LPS O-acetylase OafA/YrhL